MAVLSDRDIKRNLESGKIVISDLTPEQISLASVDLRLGTSFRVFKHAEVTHVDSKTGIAEELTEEVAVGLDKPFVIHSGAFVLGATMEHVEIPDDMVARLDGRSSLGRLGIIVHSTAGSIDPGFKGKIVLEIANVSKLPVTLYPGSRICRITFENLTSPSETPYHKRKESKYKDQTGPVLSKIHQDQGVSGEPIKKPDLKKFV